MAALHLGHHDPNTLPINTSEWLQPYHRAMSRELKDQLKFRDDPNGKWYPFVTVEGNQIRELQLFLKDKGFFPKSTLSGIFGYGTKSALRLFQEYVRNIEGDRSIGVPDGVLGPNTSRHINRWKQEGVRSTWAQYSIFNPSPNYLKWFEILHRARSAYLVSDDPVIQNLRSYPNDSDSLPPEHWTYKPSDTHLLGVRCQPEVTFDNRPNDDLFILLIKGMVFTFSGSTDPNPAITRLGRHQEGDPFISEGQHKYRFGWHKVSSRNRVYMALRPYRKGVLVFRDRKNRNQLLQDDILRGFGPPNPTINIHWTPDADRNWSAGCQVISGESYIDTDKHLISCREYAATHYNQLSAKKTRGAYNVLTDLVISLSQADDEIVWYTLGRQENLNQLAPELGSASITEKLAMLRST